MLKDTNWKSFVGQQVEVQKDGEFIRTGFVLDVVDSADILWLEAAEPNNGHFLRRQWATRSCLSPVLSDSVLEPALPFTLAILAGVSPGRGPLPKITEPKHNL